MPKRLRRNLFVLILIGLLTSGPGCYQTVGDDDDDEPHLLSTDGTGTDTTRRATDNLPQDTETGQLEGNPDTDTEEPCPWGWSDEHEVPSPDPGEAADPDALCANGEIGDGTVPAVNADVSFALEAALDDISQVQGTIVFPDALADRLTESVVVEIIDADYSRIQGESSITDVSVPGGVVTFSIAFPARRLYLGYSYIQLRVSAELTCDNDSGETQPFTAETRFELCGENGAAEWVASGEVCEVCTTMCEVVATPIPAPDWDRSPLSGMPEADIHTGPLADGTVRLTAEPLRTTGEVTYEWRVSAGELLEIQGNTALWRPPTTDGPHLVQVALKDDHSAGVSTLSWTSSRI